MIVNTDRIRAEVSGRLDGTQKANLGQFLTPSPVAHFMASLFRPSSAKECSLLDAGGERAYSMKIHRNIKQAIEVLSALGFPRAQQNERSALCLLALLNLTREKTWRQATNPLIGITPIMDWARQRYHKKYAPNTRETIRRQTMHQFVDAGIAHCNPDDPLRPVSSDPFQWGTVPRAL